MVRIMQTRKSLLRGLKLYLSSALVYGLGLLPFFLLDYYHNWLFLESKVTLVYLYTGYLVVAPVYYLLFGREDSVNKPLLLLRAVRRAFQWEKPTQQEKVAILFILVKLFFLPIMINFVFNNLGSLMRGWGHWHWYPYVLTIMFLIDTFVFALAYAFEFKTVKNVVKSVEPTFLGWAVALICYPPFNVWAGKVIPWGANDYVFFLNQTATLILRIVVIFLLVIYVWATLALGPKASNLTNRGIVWRFPYSVIRHPAYISKNLLWWVTLLPVINIWFFLGMAFWSFIYYLRAITEEKHLLADPEYRKYCMKVRWKFIPGVW